MSPVKAIHPMSALQNRAAELVELAKSMGRPVVVTEEGKPRAILQDIETYERERRALQLLLLVAEGEVELLRSGLPCDQILDRISNGLQEHDVA